MPDMERPLLTLDMSWSEEDGNLVVTGCASFPDVDQENEIVLREAIEDSLENFMALPVLHLDHTERPIGIVQSAQFGSHGELIIRGTIKPTADCADVRDRIRRGELSQYSIYGRRIHGSESCRLHPEHRKDNPCITRKLHLDSISVCPRGNAISPQTFLEIVKGIVAKSMTTASALIHPTADGVSRVDSMTEEFDRDESPGGESAMSSVLQQILDHVSEFGDRLDDLEEQVASIGGPSSPAPQAPAPEPGIQDEGGDPGYEDEAGGPGDGYEDDQDIEKGSDADYDMGDALQTIGEALTVLIKNDQKIFELLGNGNIQKAELEEEEDEEQPEGDEEYPDDGYEEEEYSDEEEDEEPEEIQKCGIKKGRSSDIELLQTRIRELESELATVLKKARPRQPIVLESTPNKNGRRPTPVSLAHSLYGGV